MPPSKNQKYDSFNNEMNNNFSFLKTNLGNEQIGVIKVAAIEFRTVARRRADFDTNFLAFTGSFDGFVIHFNVSDDANVDKLRDRPKKKKK